MDRKQHFIRMFRYDHWANSECLAAIRGADPLDAGLLRLMAHILSAQKLWLQRLEQRAQSMPVWPTSTVEECSALAEEMAAAWKDHLSLLPAEDFDKEIQYRNSKGEPWSSRVEDVLTHVVMHGTYHRGQLAMQMRASGRQPAYTDFVHAVRQGFVK